MAKKAKEKKNIFGYKIVLLWIWFLLIIFVFGNTANIAFSEDLPVIPDATGWGITTPAGGGGDVHRVTKPNPSGAEQQESGADPDESQKPPAPKNLRIVTIR